MKTIGLELNPIAKAGVMLFRERIPERPRHGDICVARVVSGRKPRLSAAGRRAEALS